MLLPTPSDCTRYTHYYPSSSTRNRRPLCGGSTIYSTSAEKALTDFDPFQETYKSPLGTARDCSIRLYSGGRSGLPLSRASSGAPPSSGTRPPQHLYGRSLRTGLSDPSSCAPSRAPRYPSGRYRKTPPPPRHIPTDASLFTESTDATSGSGAPSTRLHGYGLSTAPPSKKDTETVITVNTRPNDWTKARFGPDLSVLDKSERDLYDRLGREIIKCRARASEMKPGSEQTALFEEANDHVRYRERMVREARAASKSSNATASSRTTGSTAGWGRFAAKSAVTGLVVGGVLCAATGINPLEYVDSSHVDSARSGASSLITGASDFCSGATSAMSSGATSLWDSAAPYASSVASGASNVASGLWSGGSSVLSGVSGYMSGLTGIGAGAAGMASTCTAPAYPAFPEAATSALNAAPVVSEATRTLCGYTGRLANSSGFASYCSSMIPGWTR